MYEEDKDFGGQGFHFHAAGFPFDHLIKRFEEHFRQCGQRMSKWIPYNLEERENEYLILVPLPGRAKDEVKISLIGRTINIVAKKPKDLEDPQAKKNEEKSESLFQSVSRRFFTFIDADIEIPLPENADENNIKSSMSKGLLKIRIGRKAAKNINIDINGNN